MILFRGEYQNILVPGRNYILLEKDFSNIYEVFEKMNNEKIVNSIINNTYNDIILSGIYHYKLFIESFDNLLDTFTFKKNEIESDILDQMLSSDFWKNKLKANLKQKLRIIRYMPFPGRNIIKKIVYIIGYKNNN